ncbi:DUF2231 domain-containing protein [Alkalilimnicola sp. S0819]|uniref:DUF2231 domain-containing protein n=1 Tax=Alkalilimnicola sp. S0819 TaxID=2613922 RepID=UPI00126167C5|nr:DUF2231 domain-containing protein [Alkalilimnicola sp. S0819]KAB7627539.1 DUF2231 domain-containing protein [Alkalilimnicola sp. S0819]MPQ15693.1 DUF2231 domain-containing protein [Alkalilimnicola sp. S0819]
MRHPLHPALVHFPIACWSLAVVADFAGLYFGDAAWRWSQGLLIVACIMAIPAMLAGLLELSRIPEGPALRDTWWHMGAMLLAFTLFTTRLLLGLSQGPAFAPDALALWLDAAGFVSLAIGGWLGGRLVYGHGLGRSRERADRGP